MTEISWVLQSRDYLALLPMKCLLTSDVWNYSPKRRFKVILNRSNILRNESVTGYGKLKRTLPCGPWFLVRTQRKSSGGNTSLLEKEHKEHLKGEVGHAKRGNGTRMMRYCIFKTGLLHIHLGGCGLTTLINSCKLHKNRLYCTCLSHNSVCYNQMCVCIEYLWTFSKFLAT